MISTRHDNLSSPMYDLDPHIAELYDQQETYDEDVALIQKLIGQVPVRRFRRVTKIISPAGLIRQVESIQQKHPVSAGEAAAWLEGNGFIIEHQYGDRAGMPYRPTASRAIFWARNPSCDYAESFPRAR